MQMYHMLLSTDRAVLWIGKDLTWYAKASKEDRATALQAEIAAAKQRDEDVMNEALYVQTTLGLGDMCAYY